jgi:tetratricopeptide (TPR) repeat protein
MRRRGSFSTVLVIIISLALIAGAGYFGLSAYTSMNVSRGDKMLEAEKYGDALGYFKKADQFEFASNTRVKEGLAASYYGLKEYESALHYYSIVVKEEPDNAKARYRLGLLYFRAGEFRKAEVQARALSEMKSDEARQYAADLVTRMREGMVRGIFDDLMDKVLPNLPDLPNLPKLPKIPGITDRNKDIEDEIDPEKQIEQEPAPQIEERDEDESESKAEEEIRPEEQKPEKDGGEEESRPAPEQEPEPKEKPAPLDGNNATEGAATI